MRIAIPHSQLHHDSSWILALQIDTLYNHNRVRRPEASASLCESHVMRPLHPAGQLGGLLFMSVGKPPVVENQSTTFTCCVPARVDANHSIASRTPKMRKWKKRHIPRIIDYPDLHLRPGLADPRTVLCAHDILSRAQKYIKLSLHDIVGHHHPQAYGGAFVTQSMWPYRTNNVFRLSQILTGTG